MRAKDKIAMPLFLACCNDKTENRPVMGHVHFVAGYSYASNGQILVKQSFEYLNIGSIENLNGRSLHRDVFKELCRCDTAMATSEGVECIKSGLKLMLPYGVCEGNVPNYDSVIPASVPVSIAKLMISAASLETASKCLYTNGNDRVNLDFHGEDRVIVMTVGGHPNQLALVMPYYTKSY
jgi:hypothetical protein